MRCATPPASPRRSDEGSARCQPREDRTMKFGLLLNTQFPRGESASERLQGLLDQVRAARDNGLHSVWVSQHYLAAPLQMLQQMSLLGRIGAEAGSMRIGTNIFLLPIHNPVYVAEQV